MSNIIINHEKNSKAQIAKPISQNQKNVFAKSIEDVTSSDAKLHLLFAKPLTHALGAGINPLVDSAATIFASMGKLTEMHEQPNFKDLHIALVKEIDAFRATLIAQNYMPKYVNEFIPIATYLLCATLDDIILNTAWGHKSKWTDYRLLNTFNLATLSKENFLIILERFIQDQVIFIDMIEFTYICLNLGFSNNCRISGFSIDQLQRIILSLYKRIRIHYGSFSKTLSPYSLKNSQINYFQAKWLKSPVQLIKKQFADYSVVSTISEKHPVISQEITNMKLHYYKMNKFLRNKIVKINDQKIQLATLPWILFTGSSGSGKSTLIENSKIPFVIDKNKIQNEFKDTLRYKNWNWWITPKAIFIDVPSSHILLKRDQDLFANAYFDSLLELIVETRGPKGINGVALVISLAEIMDKSHQAILVAQLAKKITSLQNRFGEDLSFNLVISKCDGVAGFCDFFDDYTNEELSQPWGVTLPQMISTETMAKGFYQTFDTLIQRINKQIIYRLHQGIYFEAQSKFHIKDFPFKVEQLKLNLGELITKVAEDTQHFFLKGFYLTSAKQLSGNKNQSNCTNMMPNYDLSKAFSIMDMPVSPNRSYFIKHLLLNGLVSEESKDC